MVARQISLVKTGLFGENAKKIISVIIKVFGSIPITWGESAVSRGWIKWCKDVRVTRGEYGEIIVIRNKYTDDDISLNSFAFQLVNRYYKSDILPPTIYRTLRYYFKVRPTIHLRGENDIKDDELNNGDTSGKPFVEVIRKELEENQISVEDFFFTLVRISGNDDEIKKLGGNWASKLFSVDKDSYEGTPGSTFIFTAIEELRKQLKEIDTSFKKETEAKYDELIKEYNEFTEKLKQSVEAKKEQLKAEILALQQSEF